jgi:BirA family biotin operon repressor/biotin-[acetyl-CoA-carboxylase] ligase
VLGSTADLCRRLAEAGEPEGYAVLAGRQTQGRGSRGREWSSPAGNLSLSVLLRPRERAAAAGQWSLLAGVALAEAFADVLPEPSGLSLKWPNDVLLDGRKLAGILIECAASGEALEWLTIGMGANLASAPDLADRIAACIADVTLPPSPAEFARAVLDRIDHWRRVRLLEGFAPIRAAWLGRAQPPGSEISLRVNGATLGGLFAGLGDDGSLLLQSNGRVRAFGTGEVLLRGNG